MRTHLLSRRAIPLPRRGFTFIEILAAMLFMAIVIPVAIRGLTLASMVSERASRKRLAAELAAKTLNEAMVTQTWRDGAQEGDYGEEYPGITWKIYSEGWSEDAMNLVTVEVAYRVQGITFTETLSTLAEATTTSSAESSAGGTRQ